MTKLDLGGIPGIEGAGMTIQRKFLLVSLIAALLSYTVVSTTAVRAASSAKNIDRSLGLHVGPVDAGSGYEATLSVIHPNGVKPVINLKLTKTADSSTDGIVSSATQTHWFNWRVASPLTRVAADLSSAKLSSGELQGGYAGLKGRFVAKAPIKKKRSCRSTLPLAAARTGIYRSSMPFDTQIDAFGTIDFGGAKAMLEKVKWEAGHDACGKPLPSFVPWPGIEELKPYCRPESIHFEIFGGGVYLQADSYGEETHIEAQYRGAWESSRYTSAIVATTNDPAAFTATSDLSSASLDLDNVPFLNQSAAISPPPYQVPFEGHHRDLTLANSSLTGFHQCFDLSGTSQQVALDEPFTVTFDGVEPMQIPSEQQVGNLGRLK